MTQTETQAPTMAADAQRFAWLSAHPGRVQYSLGEWCVAHVGDVRGRVSFMSPGFATLRAAIDYALAGNAGDVDAAALAATEAAP